MEFDLEFDRLAEFQVLERAGSGKVCFGRDGNGLLSEGRDLIMRIRTFVPWMKVLELFGRTFNGHPVESISRLGNRTGHDAGDRRPEIAILAGVVRTRRTEADFIDLVDGITGVVCQGF